MTHNAPSDGYAIATTDGRGDVSVLAHVPLDALTGPSADLVREGNRMLLLAAVARQILCPAAGTVLNVRDAVLIEAAGRTYVMSAAVWDERGPAFLAAHPDTDVIDGRTL